MKPLFALILLFISSAHGDSDKDKFKAGATQVFHNILCDQSFLACLSRSAIECDNSLNNAINSCSIDASYKAASSTYNDMNKASEKIKTESLKYRDCVIPKFYKNLNIDEEMLIKCESSIQGLKVNK